MAKRTQIYLSEEAQKLVDDCLKEANENFRTGTITLSDLVSEMILNSKIDIKSLQLKRTDLRRSLRLMSDLPDLDLDTVMRTLSELKIKPTKKSVRGSIEPEELP